MAKKNRSIFDVIASYIDPANPRSYGTVVIADGKIIAATDGFSACWAASDLIPGAYLVDGTLTHIKVPNVANVCLPILREKNRLIESDELLMETLAIVKPKAFIGLAIDPDDRIRCAISAPKTTDHWGDRIWFNAGRLQTWLPKGATNIRVTEEALLAESCGGAVTHLVLAVKAGKG